MVRGILGCPGTAVVFFCVDGDSQSVEMHEILGII